MRSKWRDEARRAIADLKGVAHGAREAEMQAIAKHLSGHNDTSALRRAIAAHEFLDHLEAVHPVAYSHLANAPLSIVEVIARWFAFDTQGALSTAKDWADGIGNVRTINKAMLAARPAGYAGKSGSAMSRAYVSAAKPFVIEALQGSTQGDLRLVDASYRHEATGQTLDFIFEVGGDHALKRIAVVVVGPYSNRKLYAARSGDWVTRGFGLAWVFDRIVLAVPDAQALPDYSRRIGLIEADIGRRPHDSVAKRFPPSVQVVHIDVPKLTAEEDEMLRSGG